MAFRWGWSPAGSGVELLLYKFSGGRLYSFRTWLNSQHYRHYASSYRRESKRPSRSLQPFGSRTSLEPGRVRTGLWPARNHPRRPARPPFERTRPRGSRWASTPRKGRGTPCSGGSARPGRASSPSTQSSPGSSSPVGSGRGRPCLTAVGAGLEHGAPGDRSRAVRSLRAAWRP